MTDTPRDRCWCGGTATRIRRGGDWVEPFQSWACSESIYHDPQATGRPTEIKRLYIAGPCSGYPENNYPEFNRVEKLLQATGFETVNPASFGNVGSHYVDLIREDLRAMLDCDAVAVLDNWWESVGARNEVQVAGLLKMPVRTFAEWLYIQEKLG